MLLALFATGESWFQMLSATEEAPLSPPTWSSLSCPVVTSFPRASAPAWELSVLRSASTPSGRSHIVGMGRGGGTLLGHHGRVLLNWSV